MTQRSLPVLPSPAEPIVKGPVQWLELSLDYRCNLRCLGCRSCLGGDESLSRQDMARWLAWGRRKGIEGLWIGGGEPTLRDELPVLVQSARKAGYTRILLQTNGMRTSYAPYAQALARAGLTHARVNLKSHRASTHDALSGAEGSLVLALEGARQLIANGIEVSADILLTRTTTPELPDTVDLLMSLGVRSAMLWLLSAHDSTDPAVLAEIPRFSEMTGDLSEAYGRAQKTGFLLESLHTPACVLPESLRAMVTPAATLRLLVVNPGSGAFPLEESPIEGGAYLESCARCIERPRCSGPRADYLEIHGAAEFAPITTP